MAAAVIPDPTFSTLYGNASKWSDCTPDYEYYAPGVSAPTPTGSLVNLATHLLTLIAFVPTNNNDAIYVGHSLTILGK